MYAYDTWRPFPSLSLTGGISYDRLSYPTDYRNPPILDSESSRSRVSPKAGFIWNPMGKLTFRGAYTRSLGGVSFDESVRLEPNQVAGFNQVFRSIISESVVGSVAAPTFENAGLLVEDKFGTGTYVALQATLLRSDVDRRIGTFDAFVPARDRLLISPICHLLDSAAAKLRRAESPLYLQSTAGRSVVVRRQLSVLLCRSPNRASRHSQIDFAAAGGQPGESNAASGSDFRDLQSSFRLVRASGRLLGAAKQCRLFPGHTRR